MQVQLHTLFALGCIFAFSHSAGHHGEGLENHLIIKLIDHQLTLHTQHAAQLHIFQNGLGLICLHEAVDAD